MSIWDILSQHEEIPPNKDYEDNKEFMQACTSILQAFQRKGILDETIIEHQCEWDTESYAIMELLNEIIDEFTKKRMVCTGGYHNYQHKRHQRTNRDTCWYCGAELREAREDEKEEY